ncbi:MAG: S9 family peptidase [Candidatus Zixiibacteriota bacterium]|nr:MAG: S9 family peptidase [candidate division Zixibacteria bacterium]
MRQHLRTRWFAVAATIAILFIPFAVAAAESVPAPPETTPKPVVDTLHGVAIEDPYRWLEDQNGPETRAWIEAQNKYTESFFAHFPNSEATEKRLEELLRIDDISTPLQCGGRYFLMKRNADQEQYVICMREGLDGPDKVLVDPASICPDLTCSVGMYDVTDDGKLLAYSVRQGGEDQVEIHFLNVDSGEELGDVLVRGLYFGLSITADKSGMYYVLTDSTGGRLYHHRFGDDFANDPMLFGEGYGPSEIISAGLSEDRRYLQITVYYGAGAKKSDVFVKNVAEDGPIEPVITGLNALSWGQICGDEMYVMTNHEAPNWRILVYDLASASLENSREIIPTSDKVVMEFFSTVGGRLYVNCLEDVTSHVKIFEPDGTYIGELDLPSLGSVSYVSGRWDGKEAFYGFSSFHVPPTVYRHDLESDTREVFEKPSIPIDADNLTLKQVWYESKDGTKVPMFVLHRKDLVLDGSNHTYLTGYGGFNSAYTPYFSQILAFWAETGGVVAVPNLRGGGEFGEAWHEAGMLENKQNVFDDFVAAAEWLIENRYTSPAKLAIRGGSNGGLLVGAVMNQRPELFGAVICTYPLLDMLRYHDLLMGPYWIGEYGSADDPEQFEYIYKYSPYHNVNKTADYPAVMFVTGDSDTRVDPMHARKMTALLQTAVGTDSPVLLYYDTKAGHSGGTPMTKRIKDNAVQLGFLFWQLGVSP